MAAHGHKIAKPEAVIVIPFFIHIIKLSNKVDLIQFLAHHLRRCNVIEFSRVGIIPPLDALYFIPLFDQLQGEQPDSMIASACYDAPRLCECRLRDI